MGLRAFFQGSPLKKLEAELEENPSPEAVIALAQKHVEMGVLDEALVVAEKGLQTFKNAPKLKELIHFIKKKRAADSIKRLRDELKVKPSPTAFTQLADIYRELGEIDQALDLLSECRERFPDEVVAHRMYGQIRLENFLQEVIAYDGQHAYEALQRAQALAAEDPLVRMQLAQLYFAVGANALAVKELKAELAVTATALDIKEFLTDVGSPPPLPPDVSIESLVERCEESGALTNSLQGFPRVRPGLAKKTSGAPRINTVAVGGLVKSLAATPGLLNLAILDREGKVVASLRGEGGWEEEAFRAFASATAGVATEACRRMDIGSFVRGVVAFPEGGAAVVRRRGMTFALHFHDPLKQERAAPILEDLCGKVVGGGGA